MQKFCALTDELTETNMTRVIAITNDRHDIVAAGVLALDSGTEGWQGQKFCFHAGMTITSFHFNKAIT